MVEPGYSELGAISKEEQFEKAREAAEKYQQRQAEEEAKEVLTGGGGGGGISRAPGEKTQRQKRKEFLRKIGGEPKIVGESAAEFLKRKVREKARQGRARKELISKLEESGVEFKGTSVKELKELAKKERQIKKPEKPKTGAPTREEIRKAKNLGLSVAQLRARERGPKPSEIGTMRSMEMPGPEKEKYKVERKWTTPYTEMKPYEREWTGQPDIIFKKAKTPSEKFEETVSTVSGAVIGVATAPVTAAAKAEAKGEEIRAGMGKVEPEKEYTEMKPYEKGGTVVGKWKPYTEEELKSEFMFGGGMKELKRRKQSQIRTRIEMAEQKLEEKYQEKAEKIHEKAQQKVDEGEWDVESARRYQELALENINKQYREEYDEKITKKAEKLIGETKEELKEVASKKALSRAVALSPVYAATGVATGFVGGVAPIAGKVISGAFITQAALNVGEITTPIKERDWSRLAGMGISMAAFGGGAALGGYIGGKVYTSSKMKSAIRRSRVKSKIREVTTRRQLKSLRISKKGKVQLENLLDKGFKLRERTTWLEATGKDAKFIPKVRGKFIEVANRQGKVVDAYGLGKFIASYKGKKFSRTVLNDALTKLNKGSARTFSRTFVSKGKGKFKPIKYYETLEQSNIGKIQKLKQGRTRVTSEGTVELVKQVKKPKSKDITTVYNMGFPTGKQAGKFLKGITGKKYGRTVSQITKEPITTEITIRPTQKLVGVYRATRGYGGSVFRRFQPKTKTTGPSKPLKFGEEFGLGNIFGKIKGFGKKISEKFKKPKKAKALETKQMIKTAGKQFQTRGFGFRRGAYEFTTSALSTEAIPGFSRAAGIQVGAELGLTAGVGVGMRTRPTPSLSVQAGLEQIKGKRIKGREKATSALSIQAGIKSRKKQRQFDALSTGKIKDVKKELRPRITPAAKIGIKQEQKQLQKLKLSQEAKEPTPVMGLNVRMPGEFIPGLFMPEKEPRYRKKGRVGYQTFVRRKGKWKKITDKPMTKSGARSKGARRVDNTVARSFKTEPIKEKKTVKGKAIEVLKRFGRKQLEKGDNYFSMFRSQLRKPIKKGRPQKQSSVFIEKSEGAISTRGEKSELRVARKRKPLGSGGKSGSKKKQKATINKGLGV